ncbi:MAG TPA: hypothetical protein VGJ68_13800 [Bradyrhizobium sp.]|jgi:hypothetical protein
MTENFLPEPPDLVGRHVVAATLAAADAPCLDAAGRRAGFKKRCASVGRTARTGQAQADEMPAGDQQPQQSATNRSATAERAAMLLAELTAYLRQRIINGPTAVFFTRSPLY